MKRTILPGKNVDIRLLRELDIEHFFVTLEWLPVVKLIEPIYSTLVCVFYTNAEVYTDLYIVCTLRGIELRLDAKKICKIARVPSVGLKVEDMKI